MKIEYLRKYKSCIDQLAKIHFDKWGKLTGRDSIDEYKELLQDSADNTSLPTTLVAVENDEVIGSVNLVKYDLPGREDLIPWLAQLYVFPEKRAKGIGAALVEAAVDEAQRQNWPILYLYTSGTLPEFYERHGWSRTEEIKYLDRMRVIMGIATDA